MKRNMDGDKVFCTQCGTEMGRDEKFCPSCGANVDGTPNPYAGRSSGYSSPESSSLDTTRLLIMLYGIAALAFGVLGLVGVSMLNDPAMQQALKDMGVVITDDYVTSAMIECAVIIVSAACALVSSFLVKKRTNYTAALVLCIAAAATSFAFGLLFGIVTFVVGLYMAYRIKQGQALFS
ncbi:MAG: zinc ribbon domain-containing protein [Thermoplasmata archaeon]|jgi:hypothetical protein|nr:zinc ribbon domain-containing protein [Thermoplasmata archaeon]